MATTTLSSCALTPASLRHTDPRFVTSVPIRRLFGGSGILQRNARFLKSGNALVLPVIKAQAAPGTFDILRFGYLVGKWIVNFLDFGLIDWLMIS